jgi:tetratricopeptide (TPR) repeat protein
LWKDQQHEQAIAEVERAIALDPNDAESYMALGNFLNFVGRVQEAIEWGEKAMRLNPYPSAFCSFTLGVSYHLTGQSEKAIAALRRAISQSPNFLPSRLILAALYSELERFSFGWDQVAAVGKPAVNIFRANGE